MDFLKSTFDGGGLTYVNLERSIDSQLMIDRAGIPCSPLHGPTASGTPVINTQIQQPLTGKFNRR